MPDFSFGGSASVNSGLCQGRLTLTSATPVTTSDVTAASTLYFTPYGGNRVALYSGTAWAEHTLTERSLALSGLTSGKNYDVFLYDNGGTLTLELSTAWTNDTTRAAALATQDGVYVKTDAADRRYVGTIRTTGTTTTEDSVLKRFVWNYKNRALRPMRVVDATDTWDYNTDAWQQVNASAANQVAFVLGLAEDPVLVRAKACVKTGNAGATYATGVGLDSTTVNSAQLVGDNLPPNLTAQPTSAEALLYPSVGYHYLAWLERTNMTGVTVTWYGDTGLTWFSTGLVAQIYC